MAVGHGGARKGAGRKKGVVSKAKETMSSRAREFGDIALQTLVDVCSDVVAPPSARVSAANAILDRGYGRPMQALDHSSSDGTMTPAPSLDVSRLSTAALEEIIAAADAESFDGDPEQD